ncbi:zinc finger protein BRUTUS-like At1g18910 isoform X1 [Lathyrus oleraceus]|uniref:zinc finger protein BRUTUS-like At1g18910 isoform X1 n=2 Tax=Pisum sativum TaxID=3888 RepID=UPI0021D037EC|nr:zinc finger protein BRUTUS-like At1g18910 isoform X1 [Pisum sativum]
MGGGDPSLSDMEEEEEEENGVKVNDSPDILSQFRLLDAPILLFVCFHKALRSELDQLRVFAETASLEDDPDRCREIIVKLQQRFQFVRLAHKYHCAAEDEIIFHALDAHVKNVVCTYSLEHNSTDGLFDSILHFLDELTGSSENISKLFRELVYCIDILQTSIYQHMLKEEEQVFPLLIQNLSTKEQASLVWQFICSVPIMLLEEVLPWMVSFLSADKQAEVTQCFNEIAPMERALQEVLVSWLGSNRQTFSGTYFHREELQGSHGSQHIENFLGQSSCNRNYKDVSSQMKVNDKETEDGVNQVKVLHLWHNAIRKDLKEIQQELYLIRNSGCSQNLDSILIQLKFLADVLIFYSNALKKFFHPIPNKLAHSQFSKSIENLLGESHIEDIQQLLLYNSESEMPLTKFVEKLCGKLELFISAVNKQFSFQEIEVFPIFRENCRNGMQVRLLSLSMHMMPLGLLKCVITWFSVHLSEKESRSILYCIKEGNNSVSKAFAPLLHEWFRIGYSGKTSIEKFRQDLQYMFKRRHSFSSEKMKETCGFSFLSSDKQPHKSCGKNCLSHSSSSGAKNVNKYETPYSTGINLHIFFPDTAMKLNQHPRFHAANLSSVSFLNDPKPIDLIFFFHKAIKKDLDYLVLGSAQLEGHDEFIDFQKRFHLICFLHQIHSDAEDEIVFPALEAIGQLKNISLAYTFDHKHEVEHFSKISRILDRLSELHPLVSTTDSKIRVKRMLRRDHLIKKLQEMCKSMHKLLSDHINREEIEIWPIIREFFSNREQGKIIGCMLGRISAEILQDMIPWLMASLTQEEQHILMFLWSMATKNTMFDEWLSEWWNGYSLAKAADGSNGAPLQNVDPLDIISKYLSEEVLNELQEESSANKSINFWQKDLTGNSFELSNSNVDDKVKVTNAAQNYSQCSKCTNQFHDIKKHTCNEVKPMGILTSRSFQHFDLDKSGHYDRLLKLSQDDLERVIRRVSRDSCLDPQNKSYIIQSLLTSRWIISQKISSMEVNIKSDGLEFPGKHPSYKDPLKQIYGCKHYKRNCKLFAPCCNELHACIHCHDEVSDHLIDRKSITMMMCMKCLVIQPINATCSSVSCRNLSMAKYYCRICKLFEDESRKIYHCPFCNLCRLGKGLGVDFFHCMNCNACMSRSLMIHTCREKSLEENCPICHEYIFTSCSPVKALPCGHVMHSTCFQEYTCFNYTCPICSKSLGDMQVYFRMLDALLAEEKMSDEFLGQMQVILCNDCEKKGAAPFHWLYHKCISCGSYNTRVL